MSDDRHQPPPRSLFQQLPGLQPETPEPAREPSSPPPPERRPGASVRRCIPALVVVALMALGWAVYVLHVRWKGAADGTPSRPLGTAGIAAFGPSSGDSALTELTGVWFRDQGEPPVLYGRATPGQAPISRVRVAEYFAIAMRSFFLSGEAPGVSIDPATEQIQYSQTHNGMMQGNMAVRYEGRTYGTSLGLVMLAADRRMKCLSFGRDNILREPVSLGIPSFQTEFDIALAEPGASSPAQWHRFWFVPDSPTVGVGADGRFSVEADLRVEVRRMVPTVPGRLEDAKEGASPSALAFAAQFKDHFAEIAAADPVFRELRLAAQVTAIAKAIYDRATDDDPGNDIAIDVGHWVVRHPVRRLTGPKWTPALVDQRSTQSTETRGSTTVTTTRTLTLVGGVDLAPNPLRVVARAGDPPGTLENAPRTPGSSYDEVTVGDLTLTPSPSDRAAPGDIPLGAGWVAHVGALPRLLVGDLHSFSGQDGKPRTFPLGFLYLPADASPPVYLSKHLTRTEQPSGLSHELCTDPSGSVEVEMFRDAFRLRAPADEVVFSPQGLPQSVRDQTGRTAKCAWDNGRLRDYTGTDGSVIRFRYNGRGELESIDGPPQETARQAVEALRSPFSGVARATPPLVRVEKVGADRVRLGAEGRGSAEIGTEVLAAAARGQEDARARVRERLSEVLPEGLVVVTGCSDDLELQRNLNAAVDASDVVVAHDAERARRHLGRMGPVRRVLVLVHWGSLEPGHRTALAAFGPNCMNAPTESWAFLDTPGGPAIDPAADTLVIVGHRPPSGESPFDRDLLRELNKGRLAGKSVAIVACGNPDLAQLSDTLVSGGARGTEGEVLAVTAFAAEVNPAIVPLVVEAIDELATPLAGEAARPGFLELIGSVLDRARDRAAGKGELPPTGVAPLGSGGEAIGGTIQDAIQRVRRYLVRQVGQSPDSRGEGLC